MFIRDEIEYGTRTAHTNMDLYDHVQEEDLKQVFDHHNLTQLQRRHARREVGAQVIVMSGEKAKCLA
ncbi:MAG TPA: hypothetical protein VHE60_14260 [Pyrinomonadaceae bacterium]|nr:hypothetical protein [Pyrinomonadaceae bacterium]